MCRALAAGAALAAAGRRGAGLAVRPLHRQRRRPDADAALADAPRAPGGGARDPEPAGAAGPAAAPAAQPQPPALRRRQRGPPARPRAPAPAPGRVRAAVPPRRLPVPGGDGQPAAPRRRQGRRLQHHGQRPDRHRPERRHHDVHQPQQAREWAAARAREAAVVRRLRGPRRRGHHGRGAPPVPEAGAPRRARPGRRHLHHHRLPGRQRGARREGARVRGRRQHDALQPGLARVQHDGPAHQLGGLPRLQPGAVPVREARGRRRRRPRRATRPRAAARGDRPGERGRRGGEAALHGGLHEGEPGQRQSEDDPRHWPASAQEG